ncbi:hypothetical protein [Candidatus Spongiihabitans sp.]|uniref:hypothetical protein n=1 Tax=Candidatus Spongiihabitans sp. TaxID=3101308 RepID=UPI003C7B6498
MRKYITKDFYSVVTKLFVIIPFIALSACASQPTASEIANADYGAYPAEYERIVKGFLQRVLKDPSSAQLRKIKGPHSQWSSYFGAAKFGYAVCYGVNAKNSFGGYTGEKTHYFLIRNGSVVQHMSQRGGDYDIEGTATQKRCYGS